MSEAWERVHRRVTALKDRGDDRRWRLFACACCWRVLPLMADDRSENAVAVAEALADGKATAEEEGRAGQEAAAAEAAAWVRPNNAAQAFARTAARQSLQFPRLAWRYAARAAGPLEEAEAAMQLQMLDDLFGPEVAFDPAWRTPTVKAIAQKVYADDDFAALPVLADALEDAGCTETVVLEHCRHGRLHVRGCWVVDVALGRPAQ